MINQQRLEASEVSDTWRWSIDASLAVMSVLYATLLAETPSKPRKRESRLSRAETRFRPIGRASARTSLSHALFSNLQLGVEYNPLADDVRPLLNWWLLAEQWSWWQSAEEV